LVSLFLKKRNGTYILDIKEFEARLRNIIGFKPGDISIYETAFIHRSATITLSDGRSINNERLEYLGDSVIDTILSDYLFSRFPDADEGMLTKARAKLVNRETLNQVSVKLGIDTLLISQVAGFKASRHIFGNALEALAGAIFVDKGYKKAKRFFTTRMLKAYGNIGNLLESENDYKSLLFEWSQREKIPFVFTFSEEYEPNNRISLFSAVLTIDNEEIATGKGSSKKEAEQNASEKAWAVINKRKKECNGQ
jgi:ribonuclease-3